MAHDLVIVCFNPFEIKKKYFRRLNLSPLEAWTGNSVRPIFCHICLVILFGSIYERIGKLAEGVRYKCLS